MQISLIRHDVFTIIFALTRRWRRHVADGDFARRLSEERQLQCVPSRLERVMRPTVLPSGGGKYTTGSEMSCRHFNDLEKSWPADRQNHLRRAFFGRFSLQNAQVNAL